LELAQGGAEVGVRLSARQTIEEMEMQGIEAALTGTLGRDVELRTSAAGKPWCKLSVAVTQESRTESETTVWIQVAVFGEVAERMAKQGHKGSRIYAEGTLRLAEWTSKTTGEVKQGLEMTAWRAQVLGAGAIGQNKVASKKPKTDAPAREQPANGQADAKRDWQAPLDEQIPFAPEVR
jgi:single stranded DNA-binding protein